MNQTAEFMEVVKSAWRHKLFVVVTSLIAGLLALGISFILPKQYEAKTVFNVSSSTDSSGMLQQLSAQFGDLAPFLGSSGGGSTSGLCEEILKSRVFVKKIAGQLGLGWDDQAVDKFRKDQLIINTLKTGAMQVKVVDEDPQRAAKLANGLVNAFVEEQKGYLKYGSLKNQGFLEEQMRQARERLDKAEANLLAVQKRDGIYDAPDQMTQHASYIARLEYDRVNAETGLRSQEARLQELQAQLKDAPKVREAQKSFTMNPQYQELTRSLRSLETELLDAQMKYTDEHPTVIALKAEIEQTQNRLQGVAEEYVSSRVESADPVYTGILQDVLAAQVQVDSGRSHIAELDHQLVKMKADGASMAEGAQEYARAALEVQIAQQVYLLMSQEYEKVKVTAQQDSDIVRVLDPAVVPYAPARPRKMFNVFVGVVLAGLLSTIVSFLLDRSDRRPGVGRFLKA